MPNNTWQKVRLGQIARVTSGGTPSRNIDEYWNNGEIPWITTTAINFNTISSGTEFITQKGLKNSSAKIFPPGTILMAMYGQGVTRGRVAILKIEAATNQACAAILPHKENIETQFLFYFLSNEYEQIREMAHGGNQKNLNGELIKQIPIKLPPLPEQRKIAEILSTWDKAIDLTQHLIAAKQRRKKALMQQLLTGRVRFPGFEGEWEETQLRNIASNNRHSFTGGPFGSDLKSNDYTDDGVRIIQLQNIGDGEFMNSYKIYTSEEKADELISCNIYPGEIIISKMGDPVARATIIPDIHKRYLMASDGIRLLVNTSKYNTKFILETINSPCFRKKALSQSTGSTRQRIGLTDLRKIQLKVPPLSEQHRIAAVLQACDEEINLLQQKLAALQTQKKGLMQQLLTGKVRVEV